MSIWNKVLVGLILVALLGAYYLAMRTLKTQAYWRNLDRGYRYFLQEDQEIADALTNGGDVPVTLDRGVNELRSFYREYEYSLALQRGAAWADFEKAVLNATAKTGRIDLELIRNCQWSKLKTPGTKRLRLDLQELLAGRGRVWRNCDPQTTPQTKQTGLVAVITDLPTIPDKALLYVFEETDADQGGRYLGEFNVVKVDQANKRVDLRPAIRMSSDELGRLSASAAGNATWIMYEIMPADSHEIFAELDQAQLRKLWPEGSPHAREYINDGKPATWEQIEQWGVTGELVDDKGNPLVDAQGEPIAGAQGTYRRRIRDYEVLLREYRLKRWVLVEQKEAAARDLAYAQAAESGAVEQRKFREGEKGLLTAEKKRLDYERDTVDGLRQELTRQLKECQDSIQRLITENRAIAAQIEKIQTEATRRIDARTRSVVRSGEGDGG